MEARLRVTLRTLLHQGVSQREIEHKVRVDRKTVRKYARIEKNKKQAGDDNSKSPTPATGS